MPASTYRYDFSVELSGQFQNTQNISCLVNDRAGLTSISGDTYTCNVLINTAWIGGITIEFYANRLDVSMLVSKHDSFYGVLPAVEDARLVSGSVLVK